MPETIETAGPAAPAPEAAFAPPPPAALPEPSPDAAPFWASCRAHALALQRCATCGTWRYPPRPLCPACHASEATWQPVRGTGRVYVTLVVHQARGAGPTSPYNLALVELEEGVRLWSNVVGTDPRTVRIGDQVRLVYDDVTDQVTLPRFRCEESVHSGDGIR